MDGGGSYENNWEPVIYHCHITGNRSNNHNVRNSGYNHHGTYDLISSDQGMQWWRNKRVHSKMAAQIMWILGDLYGNN